MIWQRENIFEMLFSGNRFRIESFPLVPLGFFFPRQGLSNFFLESTSNANNIFCVLFVCKYDVMESSDMGNHLFY